MTTSFLSFIQRVLYYSYIHCKSVIFILFFCYATACTTIQKYGTGPNNDIINEEPKNDTGYSSAPVDQSIINQLYECLDVAAGEPVDSNKFIELLNSQDEASLKTWINKPYHNGKSKLPPMFHYVAVCAELMKNVSKEKEINSLIKEINSFIKILQALIEHPSVDINKGYFSKTPFDILIDIEVGPELVESLTDRSDFNIFAKESLDDIHWYDTIAHSSSWFNIKGIRLLKDLLEKAGILEKSNDFYKILEWLVKNNHCEMIKRLLDSHEITKEKLSPISGELLYLVCKNALLNSDEVTKEKLSPISNKLIDSSCASEKIENTEEKYLQMVEYLLNHQKIRVNRKVDIGDPKNDITYACIFIPQSSSADEIDPNYIIPPHYYSALTKLIILHGNKDIHERLAKIINLFISSKRFEINATELGYSAFSYAALYCDEKIVDIFIKSNKVKCKPNILNELLKLYKLSHKQHKQFYKERLLFLLANKHHFYTIEDNYYEHILDYDDTGYETVFIKEKDPKDNKDYITDTLNYAIKLNINDRELISKFKEASI